MITKFELGSEWQTRGWPLLGWMCPLFESLFVPVLEAPSKVEAAAAVPPFRCALPLGL